MLIREVRLGPDGDRPVDVRLAGGCIERIGRGLAARDQEPVIEARGGTLLPGLHDHHLHLMALAAARRSLRCGPPETADPESLAAALRDAPPGDDWIRGVGYHESVAGALDARSIDAWRNDRPVRIQHRSGAMWVVNTPGLARLGIEDASSADVPEGVERDEAGRPTGRLFRVDDWLRDRLGASAPPDLADVGTTLARYGVTGVTDATPRNGAGELATIGDAVSRGALPQRVRLMGSATLPEPSQPGVSRGALKLVLSEHELPAFETLVDGIRVSHSVPRAVAIHCVTRAELALAVAAFEEAGPLRGDRIEHASVAPPELVARLAELGLWVVTQPNFVRERGDAYLRDVEARDQPWLYRCQGLLEAGVAVGGGTDAPFGDPDPWLAMQAALERRTAAGVSLGEAEALSPERALALFTTAPDEPGGAPRRLAPEAPADLCLLDLPWARARDRLEGELVVATWVGGRLVWQREGAG